MDVLARHIQLHECLDTDSLTLVRRRYSLGTQETDLLCRIPVEFNWVSRSEVRSKENSKGFDQVDSSSSIIVSARCSTATWISQVDGVHVSSENRGGTNGICAWYFGNDRRLHIAMTEEVDGHITSTVFLCVLHEEKNQT